MIELDWSWIGQLKPLLGLIVLIVTALLGKYIPGWRRKLKDLSVTFNDMSESFKDPAQTEADFDKIYKGFEMVLADPPGQPLNWEDVLKIDWGPGGLWKQLKGPAFLLLFALLGLAGGALAVIEVLQAVFP